MRIGLAGLGRIGAFHADTLLGLPAVTTLVVTDARGETARETGARLRAAHPDKSVEVVTDSRELLDGLDGLVIATATPGHAEWIRGGLEAGVATFCEKPVAGGLAETIDLARLAARTSTPVHVGHHRRFDPGFRRLREAVTADELGFITTIRATSHDRTPPHPSFIPTSGGIYRDCLVHDIDAVRFVTGREVASVYAVGANKGAAHFGAAGDVDTGAALLTLDDDTLVLVSATRYNGAGYDVRMEVHGELGTLAAGLDEALPMRSAQEGVGFPHGPARRTFMERFLPAYRDELTAFLQVAADRGPSPCTIADALAAFRVAEACELSRAEARPVPLTEIEGL
ncbi:Gfo/Idh/MocA family protein [Janibacter alittae]|uniref:Gfo/Idh/MocA family oxidoreductase n=1 Tax=Janibacter alittae TaxID=3115209 RepID=A0ABZ2MH73_9MICO